MAFASDLIQIGIPARHADFLGDIVIATLSASGTTQATGKVIAHSINHVVTATAGANDSFVLPSAKLYKQSLLFVRNDSGATINIFPFKSASSPESINTQAADTAITLETGKGLVFFRAYISGVIRWITIREGKTSAEVVAAAFPAWTNYTPTHPTIGGMVATSTALSHARYLQIGKVVHFSVVDTMTLSGSASEVISTSLPVPCHDSLTTCSLSVYDAGTWISIVTPIFIGGGEIYAIKTSGVFTLHAGVRVHLAGTYEAA